MKVVGFPMHGENKLRREGLRTRDGHILEWVSRLRPEAKITVVSRPEPWPRVSTERALARRSGRKIPYDWTFKSPQVLAVPKLRDRHGWWARSARFAEAPPQSNVELVWNPFAPAGRFLGGATEAVVFDLLDDWTVHKAFEGMAIALESAYARMFSVATVVTANSEGTLDLAHRFGRSDAVLLLNGVDPTRFDLPMVGHSSFTVGYGGKIGHRINVELVAAVARSCPNWRFEFAGPVLVKDVGVALRAIPNVVLLGDVHYQDYPSAMRNWDIAWVPHRVGDGEVGGDVIKPYEYRAAGLPVVSTRLIGWQRALPEVRIADDEDVLRVLIETSGDGTPMSVPRVPHVTPTSDTWESKTARILELAGV